MLVSDVFRRVQALIGDRGEVLILKTDMIDWLNDAIDEIIRETHHGEITQSFAASTGFVTIASFEALHGKMPVKRATYNNLPLVPMPLEDLDAYSIETPPVGDPNPRQGTPSHFYVKDSIIRFYPMPLANDTKMITVTLADIKAALTTPGSDSTALPIPLAWHTAVVDYVLSKAHEKNQDWDAANRSMIAFKEATGQRVHESNAVSDSYPVIRDDVADWA